MSVFLEKRPGDVFRGTLSLVAVPKWFYNDFLCLHSSKRWESALWYNLDKKLKWIKGLLKKKQFSLYWIRHRYQSKTCVDHIEQMIDKSLINSTNPLWNLLYFLHMRVICFRYCKKCVRSQIKKILTFLVESTDMSCLTFWYRKKVLNICRDIAMHWIFYTFFVKFVVETFLFSKAHFSEVLWLLQWV